MPPLEPPLEESAEEIRAALAPLRNDVSIAVEAAGNAFAVGAIIRVAHSFLVSEVILIGEEPHYEKASMGMHRLENIVRMKSPQSFLEHVRGRDVIAFEREHARRSLYAVDEFPARAVLLFGSERFGITKTLLDASSDVLAIPLYGVNNSLPVTVAAGIALSFWAYRRYADGAVISGGSRAR